MKLDMISEKQQNAYNARREQSIKKVEEAIAFLKAIGQPVTKKALLEKTGLSSGTFSKDYIIEVLKKNEVCQFKDTKKVRQDRVEKSLSQTNNKLQYEVERLKSKLKDRDIENEILIKKINELNNQLLSEKKEYEILLGKFQDILKKYYAYGNDIDIPGIELAKH